jgi:hypothetical protein
MPAPKTVNPRGQREHWRRRLSTGGGAPSAPVNTAAPSITGSPVVSATLTGSIGSWTGAVSYAWAWQRNGSDIAGASGTGTTVTGYTVQLADVGQALRLRVTATNAGGSTAAFSSAVTGLAAGNQSTFVEQSPAMRVATGSRLLDMKWAMTVPADTNPVWSISPTVSGVSVNASNGEVTVDTAAVIAPTLVTLTATHGGGTVTGTATISVAYPTAVRFGALTLAGAGAVAVGAAGVTISSGNSSGHWQLTTASGHVYLSPSSSGDTADLNAGPYALVLSSGLTVTVTVVAGAHSVATPADMAALTTLDGKTVEMQPGQYAYADTMLPGAATVATTLRAAHADQKPIITSTAVGGLVWARRANITLQDIEIFSSYTPGSGQTGSYALQLTSTFESWLAERCRIRSNLTTVSNPDDHFRALIGSGTMQVSATGTGMRWHDCLFEGGQRGLQQYGNGLVEVIGCWFRDFGYDGLIIGNGTFTNAKINWNRFESPFANAPVKLTASSIVTGGPGVNVITVSDTSSLGSVGANFVLNFLPESAVLPTGTLTAGGAAFVAMTDIPATVLSTTTIRLTGATINTAGSGVVLWKEPPHGDMIQAVAGADYTGMELIGNRMLAGRRDGRTSPTDSQGIFFNDFKTPVIITGLGAGAVDPATDTITVTNATRFGPAGDKTTLFFEGTTVPGGLASNTAYECLIVNDTTIQCLTDITADPAGTFNLRWPQHGAGQHGAYRFRGGIMAYNLLMGTSAHGVGTSVGKDSKMIGNVTLAAPGAPAGGTFPQVENGSEFGGGGAGMLFAQNIAHGYVLGGDGVLARNQLTVAYPGLGTPTYADYLTGPFNPLTIDALTAALTIKAGSAADTASPKIGGPGTGNVDYAARTYTIPAVDASYVATTGPEIHNLVGLPQVANNTDFNWRCWCDTAGATVWWMWSANPTETAAAVKAGTGAALAGSFTVASSTAPNFVQNAVPAGGTRYLHVVGEDGTGRLGVVDTLGPYSVGDRVTVYGDEFTDGTFIGATDTTHWTQQIATLEWDGSTALQLRNTGGAFPEARRRIDGLTIGDVYTIEWQSVVSSGQAGFFAAGTSYTSGYHVNDNRLAGAQSISFTATSTSLFLRYQLRNSAATGAITGRLPYVRLLGGYV